MSGHWSKEQSEKGQDFRGNLPRFSGENLERNLSLVEALRGIAEEKNATVSQVAIAWVLSRGEDIVPLVGARRRNRLEEALGALELSLTVEELARIEATIPPGAVAGDRYDPDQLALLDSEKKVIPHMNDLALTPDRILDVAEDVLRRYGPAKATVIDVARVLEVSHGSIYRHFASKAALRDAVVARWLHRVSTPLAAIAAEKEEPAVEQLYRWLERLIALKREKVFDDPELFATYHAIAQESRAVVQAHIDELLGQLTQIIESGISSGTFKVTDSRQAAKAVFNATIRFHHPAHAAEWRHPEINTDFALVWDLVLAGLVGKPGI